MEKIFIHDLVLLKGGEKDEVHGGEIGKIFGQERVRIKCREVKSDEVYKRKRREKEFNWLWKGKVIEEVK